MTEKETYRKKLIEVALPLVSINEACIHEGMSGIRRHPRSLHKWWAQRRLASVRSILFSSIIDDPGNDLPEAQASVERERLFKIISKMVKWDNTYDKRLFNDIKKIIQNQKIPPIIDPFCGGGSIPLEATRFGLTAYASDLNPVAVLITKALMEIPQRFAGSSPINPQTVQKNTIGKNPNSHDDSLGFPSDILYYGKLIGEKAQELIGQSYPKINDRTVIAWIWARTVKCPNPACGIQMPLVRTFELTKKGKQSIWIDPVIDNKAKKIVYNVKSSGNPSLKGTVTRKGAVCIACSSPVQLLYVRSEGRAKKLGQELITIVAEGEGRKMYISPNEHHAKVAVDALPKWIPESDLPKQALGFRVQLYGITKHHQLFSSRQLLSLTTFTELIKDIHSKIVIDAIKSGMKDDKLGFDQGGSGAQAYADSLITYLAFALDRCAEMWTTLSSWISQVEATGHTFVRQVVSMAWDFSEANPFSNSRGSWESAYKWISENVILHGSGSAVVKQLDAASKLPFEGKGIVFTDPPYYNNIGYADLSDFFYIWLRITLGRIYPSLFATVLTPKAQEIIANPFIFEGDEDKAKTFFLERLEKAFQLIKHHQNPEYPVIIYYAFKETEAENDDLESVVASTGWETILMSIIDAGFQICGTWPVRTERQHRLRAMGSNALASSIVLICRIRANESLATRREFLHHLKKELPSSLKSLQYSNIAPVDLAQAAIGPGMSIFSRYERILEADGSQMSVRTALQIINQELDLHLSSQDAELDQETRFCIAWFEQHGFSEGQFGEAEVLAKAKNTSIDRMVRLHIVNSRLGKVRLVKRTDLQDDLDLNKLDLIPVWLCTQLLLKNFERAGETEAARLVLKIGAGQSEIAKDLAYRLYSVCERKGSTQEALALNNLVTSWPSIQEKAGLGYVPTGQMRL